MSEQASKPPRKKPGKVKGSPKSGGRKKGTPNKNSTSLRFALDASGFNIVEEIQNRLALMVDPEKELVTLMNLLKYVYPQLKEIEQQTATLVPNSELKTESTDDLIAKLTKING